MSKRFVLIICGVIVSGCTYTSKPPEVYLEPKGYYNKPNQYADWSSANQLRLAVYLGKSKDVIVADFGKPTYTRADVKLHGKEYEEEWVYYYTRGIPLLNQNTWTCNFFLNDGIVAEVDVM